MPVNVKTFRHNPAILRREQSGSKVDLLCRLVLSASARWWKPPIYRRCVARDVIDRCQGYDRTAAERCRGSSAVVRCRRCWPNPDTLFITTSSLQHLPVLERALASGISRIVVEKPIVANRAGRPAAALLAPTEQAARVLALDHWMARGVALNARPAVAGGRKASGLPPPHLSAQDIVWIEGCCRSQAALTALVSRSHSICHRELDTRQLRHLMG